MKHFARAENTSFCRMVLGTQTKITWCSSHTHASRGLISCGDKIHQVIDIVSLSRIYKRHRLARKHAKAIRVKCFYRIFRPGHYQLKTTRYTVGVRDTNPAGCWQNSE
jgi:hypothetical protein